MQKKKLPPEATLRSAQEKDAAKRYVDIFKNSYCDTAVKLRNFPKYIRRQDATKFLACYEIFKKTLAVKGSVVECGVWHGASLMSWALFSSILEPSNLTRRIYGFDTFEGFPHISAKDKNKFRETNIGELSSGSSYEELSSLVGAYDNNRFLGHIKKVELVKGRAEKTIPKFIKHNPHLVISLLFLDFDLYGPTKTALENFYQRIPKGGIIAFDELDNPIWPGETLALLESVGIGKLQIQRVEFDPYIGYAIKK